MAVGANARYGTDFWRAKPEQKKEASFRFLEKHMDDFMFANAREVCSQDPLV